MMKKITAVLLATLSLALSACGESASAKLPENTQPGQTIKEPVQNTAPASPAPAGTDEEYAAGEELMCLASDKAEAERIAEAYGIELVNFEYGVATFHCEEDPAAVIARGRKEGLKPLEINYVVSLNDPAEGGENHEK